MQKTRLHALAFFFRDEGLDEALHRDERSVITHRSLVDRESARLKPIGLSVPSLTHAQYGSRSKSPAFQSAAPGVLSADTPLM